MQTTTWQLDDLAVLRLAGALDALTAPLALSSAQQMLIDRAPVLVVDLSQVSFIASAGIGALVRLRGQVEEHAGRLVLVAPADGRVWRLLA
ncbi:STAS domain-containing protein [Planobispora siamensis]|uniref:STAS domain-containing protein n=1 Tax=Planobispora siamensis TaxID=936338 RepID=UPI001950CF59|nr:STAS domain-containing protein [Planobispora siamensis]